MTSSMGFVVACLALMPVASVLAQSLDATLCGKSDFGNSTVLPWSFNNNAWGNITGQADGYQCMKIYDGGASWTVTYKWTGDASTVKSYPYIKVHPSNLPVPLNKIDQLNIDANWQTWVTGTENGSPAEQAAAYDRVGLIANVAVDLFLAPDATASTVVGSPIEMMIWPWWVPTILPLGYTESTPQKDTVEVNGVKWSLYHGINDPGQNVFSWLAQTNVTSMNGDYSPLLKYLYTSGYLDGGLWVGQLEMGQEIKQATAETNFHAVVSRLEIVRSGEGEQSIQEAPAPAPTPTPTPEPSPTPTPTPEPEPQTTTAAPPPPETTEAPGTSTESPKAPETVATPADESSTPAAPVTTTPSVRPIANPPPTTASPVSTTTAAPQPTTTTGTFDDSLVSIDSIPSATPNEPVAEPATTMDIPIPVSTDPMTSTISIEPTTNAPPYTEPAPSSAPPTTTTTTTTTTSTTTTSTTTNPPTTIEITTPSTTTTSRIVTSTTTIEPAPAAPTSTGAANTFGGSESSWLMIPAMLMALL